MIRIFIGLIATAVVSLGGTVLLAQGQKQELVYKTYFSSFAADSIAPLWKRMNENTRFTNVPITRSPRGIMLAGRLGNTDRLVLTVEKLPPHELLKIRVGFHVIGSWDGEKDNDRLTFKLDGKAFLDESFSNTIYRQSYPGKKVGRTYPARTGARNSNMLAYKFVEPNVFDGLMDATYEIELEIAHTATTAMLVFEARLDDVKPGIDNESWGLEHVEVIAEGRVPPADIWPVKLQEHRIYDAEVIDFEGPDERVVAGYTQDADLDGVLPGSPWENHVHSTLLRTKCMSCSNVCLMYNYIVYTDGWVNVWSNREPFGEAMWSTTLSNQELDTVRSSVVECLKQNLLPEYEAEDIAERADLPHHEVLFRAYGREHGIMFVGGEPKDITSTLTTVLAMLKRHGWEPTPYSWD